MDLKLKSPLLAPNDVPDIDTLVYPLLVSTKMDGIRCLVINGDLYSRSGKLIPNRNLRPLLRGIFTLAEERGYVFDGELWHPSLPFCDITSVVMSHDKPVPEGLGLFIFDVLTEMEWELGRTKPFEERLKRDWMSSGANAQFVGHTAVWSSTTLKSHYDATLLMGHEGLILRNPHAKYKWGRATLKQNIIYKMKAFDFIDCTVLGCYPLEVMADGAERDYDAFGRAKPVNRMGDRVEVEALGGFTVQDELGRKFNVGSGFTMEMRRKLWSERGNMAGRWLRVKATAFGKKDLPRQGVFDSFRDPK